MFSHDAQNSVCHAETFSGIATASSSPQQLRTHAPLVSAPIMNPGFFAHSPPRAHASHAATVSTHFGSLHVPVSSYEYHERLWRKARGSKWKSLQKKLRQERNISKK